MHRYVLASSLSLVLATPHMGLPEGGLVMVTRLGRIFTYLVVPVAAWSDGTAP